MQRLRGLAARGLPRLRCVPLWDRSLPRARLARLESDPTFHDVIGDLLAYTGFSRAQLEPYLLRAPAKSFESEFAWAAPRDRAELAWFYRCSSGYVFANAIHPYAAQLDVIQSGRVLDYGAGVGCNTLGLAKRGLAVDFLEISRVQADFLRFRAARHGLENIREVLPYHAGRFDPIGCLAARYDAIVAMDVLEHIPDYHVVVRRFIECLAPGGLIVENSPFDAAAGEIALHVAPSIPLEEAMAGMTRLAPGVWRKAA